MSTTPYANFLTSEDRLQLESTVKKGSRLARDITRARILLLTDAGHSKAEIASLLTVSPFTVWRTRKLYREDGADAAITDRPRSGRPKEVTPRDIAAITALACSEPPPGVARWDHRRLTDELNARELLSAPFSRETVRRVMVEHQLKPWKKRRSGASLT